MLSPKQNTQIVNTHHVNSFHLTDWRIIALRSQQRSHVEEKQVSSSGSSEAEETIVHETEIYAEDGSGVDVTSEDQLRRWICRSEQKHVDLPLAVPKQNDGLPWLHLEHTDIHIALIPALHTIL